MRKAMAKSPPPKETWSQTGSARQTMVLLEGGIKMRSLDELPSDRSADDNFLQRPYFERHRPEESNTAGPGNTQLHS